MKHKVYCSHHLHGLMNFYSINFSSHSPSINQGGCLPTNSFSQDGGTNGLTDEWERGEEAEQEGREGRPPSYIKTNQGFVPLNCFQNKSKSKYGGANIWKLKKVKTLKLFASFSQSTKVTFLTFYNLFFQIPKFDVSDLPTHNDHYQIRDPFISRNIFLVES